MTDAFSTHRPSSIEIIHEILSSCKVDGCTRDNIKSRVQVSDAQLRSYLNALSTNMLIRRETNGFYHLTDSGNQVLKRLARPVGTIRGVQKLLASNGNLTSITTKAVIEQRPHVPKSDPNMLTVSDVADRLNVHVNSVRSWADTGLLQCYRFGSRGDRRFCTADVDEFRKSRPIGHANASRTGRGGKVAG